MHIRFIRKTTDSSKKDDTLRVQYIGTNQFSLAYTYGDVEPAVTRTTALTRGSLVHYLETTFTLLQLDEDPFEFVQLDFSLMPTVLIALRNLSKPAILTAVGLHLDRIMDEEDEYADMPALVPIDSAYCRRHEFYED